jgi:8-oxo-dGTP diphosphatase
MLAVCGIVRRKGRVLMCKRPAGVIFPGFWELPTETLDEGEAAEDALERVLFERLTANACGLRSIGAVDFAYGEGGRMLGYEVELCKNFIHIYGYDDFRWVKPQNLKRLKVLKPHVTLLTGMCSICK